MSIIMHIDLNAFFATAEELRNPSLVGKPHAVGSVGRSGIVSTASYPARKFGVHSGMPMFKALQMCPNLIVDKPDFSYYHVLSNSFFAYVQRFSSLIEKASVDECYVDMTKALSKLDDPLPYLYELQQGLLKETGLKCSIGIGPTKFLAKMASDLKKPMGITIIRRRDIQEKLYPLPIESFYGIGKKTSPRLRELGISTIGDLAIRANADDPVLIKEIGKFFYVIKDWINGYGSNTVDMEPWDPKSIGHSTTLSHDTNDAEEIKATVIELSKEVAEGATKERKKGKTIQLVVKDVSFRLHNKSVSFHEDTDDWKFISEKAIALYEQNFAGMMIRLVGVTLQNLADPVHETVQMSLFNYEEYEEKDRTRLLINELNRKLKEPMLMRGSEAKKKNGTQ